MAHLHTADGPPVVPVLIEHRKKTQTRFIENTDRRLQRIVGLQPWNLPFSHIPHHRSHILHINRRRDTQATEHRAGLGIQITAANRHIVIIAVDMTLDMGINIGRSDRIEIGIAVAGYINSTH